MCTINAELGVRKIRRILEELNFEIATPAEAQQMLAAKGIPSFLYFFDHGYPSEDAAGLHGFLGAGRHQMSLLTMELSKSGTEI